MSIGHLAHTNCLIPFVAIRLVVVGQQLCDRAIGFSQGRPSQIITEVLAPTQAIVQPFLGFLVTAHVSLDMPEGALWVEHLVNEERAGIFPVASVLRYPYGMTQIKCDLKSTAQPYQPGIAPWNRTA